MNTDKSRYFVILISTVFLSGGLCLAGKDDAARQLAHKLVGEGDHKGAAIEYRRLALMTEEAEQRAGYYWAAAHQYWQVNNCELAIKMLDRAEDNSENLTTESLILRAELALENDSLQEAKFYLQSIMESNTGKDVKALASRRLAEAMISEGRISKAKETLLASPLDNSAGLAALDNYAKGRNKTPRLGGLLGMIPGLGYAYSGEYSNALRCLILNGLFIYAMIDTADDEEWGAFSAITFFELTWYSGSVYGGIDSAHRYNRDRLNNCLKAIKGDSKFSADLKQIPVVSLKFEF